MQNRKVIITADSTCDLTSELLGRYGVTVIPYHIIIGDTEYLDGVSATPDMVIRSYYDTGSLPKTACISTGEYIEFFRPLLASGAEIVHFNLASAISTSYQNAVLAAGELGGVYPVDTRNLSTGSSLLVLEAAERRDAGVSAADIAAELSAMTGKAHSSFILDNLDFMKAGGRCSSVAALGANLLKLKPCIEMDAGGNMHVVKKYRGDLDKVLPEYSRDMLCKLSGYRRDKVFITHTDVDKSAVKVVRKVLTDAGFTNIMETTAGCTITSHCGPGCLGILFMTE